MPGQADSFAAQPAKGDHNLLVAILAFQNHFIGQQDLISALESWSADKSRSIVQVLVEQRKLTTAQQALLQAVAVEHVKLNHQDVEASLAAVSSIFVSRPSHAAHEVTIDSTVDRQREIGTSRQGPELAETLRMPPPLPAPPERHDRYQPLRQHAEGGLGLVFVAHDAELHREVALKEMKPKIAGDPGARQRFVLEAEITGGLEHPGIVPVYGLGTYADGRPFYAMRFIRGESLKSAIDAFFVKFAVPSAPHLLPKPAFQSLEFRQLLSRFVAVCNAIAYAHSRGVIHRDLKPANIMLGAFGETLVVDWGLAKATGEASPRPETDQSPLTAVSAADLAETRQGTSLGTPPYMSPEQAGGRVHEFGPATDIYLLGGTLYHLLTGRPPHRGHDLSQLLTEIQAEEVASPRTHNAAIPAPLAAICQHAMRLKPAERYGSSLALAAEVERYLADEAVQAHREPLTVRVRRALRKRPALTAAMAATMFVALAGFAIGYGIVGQKNKELSLTNVKLMRATQAAETNAHDAATQAQKAKAAAALAKSEASRANLEAERATRSFQQAREAVFTQQLVRANGETRYAPANAARLLADLRLCPLDLRDLPWRIAQQQANRLIKTERPLAAPPSQVKFSPVGDGYTLASFKGDVAIYRQRSDQQPVKLAANLPVWDVAYSHDGKWIAVAVGNITLDKPPQPGFVLIYEAADGTPVKKLEGFADRARAVAFSPNDSRLAVGGNDQQIVLFSTQDWEAERTLPGHTAGVQKLAFFSEQRLVSAAAENLGPTTGKKSELLVWNLESEEKPTAIATGDEPFQLAAFHAKQELAATIGKDDVVRVWKIPSGHLQVTYHGIPEKVMALEFSVSGEQLATAGQAGDAKSLETGSGFAGEIRVWNASEPTKPLILSGHTLPPFAVGFASDAKTLVTGAADGSVKWWRLDTGLPTAQLAIGPREIRALAITQQGDRLAAVCAVDPNAKDKSAEIVIWDLMQGRVAARWKAHANQIESLAFSSDGQFLASGAQDNAIFVWNSVSGERLHELKGHTDMVTGLAFSADGQRLASGSSDLTVRWWDWRNEQVLAVLKGHKKEVSGVAISPDGELLASCDYGGLIRLWNADEGVLITELRGHGGKLFSSIREAKFSPDGRWLASCGFDEQVLIWDVENRQLHSRLRGHQGPVYALAFTADSRNVVSSGMDGKVTFWDVQNGLERLSLRPKVANGITTLAVAPGDSGLLYGDASGTVHWLHAGGPSVQTVFHGHELPPVMEGQFTPDGQQFITLGVDRNIRIWNAENCLPVHSWIAHDAVPCALDISSDSTLIASVDMSDQIKIWRMPDGEFVQQFAGRKKSFFEQALSGVVGGASGKMINSAVFSPDGKRIAVASLDKIVRIWDPLTGKELQALAENSAQVFAVCYLSADRLVGGDTEGNVVLWDLSTGKQLARHAFGGQVMSLAATRAGDRIVVGLAKDDAGEVWSLDAQLSDPRQVRKRATPVIALSLSRDGKQLGAACLDHSIELCEFPSGAQPVMLRENVDATIQMGTPVSFSPAGDKVIAGGPSSDIYLWRRRPDNNWTDPLPPPNLFPALQAK